MLGWMLKRGDHAPEPGDGDTTQIDQPDTPAPVFAARAFKSVLFGTPSKRPQTRRRPHGKSSSSSKLGGSETPMKPQGILLTPGTGTSKRKRVSFGHDVPGGSATNLDPITELDESTATKQLPMPHTDSKEQEKKKHDGGQISDDDWEEEDEDENGDEDEDNGSRDVTVDLNEPHSQSGRYWKEEFLKYHQEAKAEMEKLLKYKQLAKSYAQQKDAEAIQLAERLRDEQQRVIKMEKKIADNASQIVSLREQSSGEDHTELLEKLTKQTTLAAQYRQRVQDLEAQMEELRLQRDNAATGNETPRRRYASTPSVSATQKTLTETRRDLRRARSQLKELDSLRDEVFGLKMQLKKAELRLAVNEKEEARATSSGPRAQELRTLLKAARDESKRKDDELRQLTIDFEAYRRDSDARDADTKAVLERAHAKIAELKKEVKSLKGAGSGVGGSRPHSWHLGPVKDAEIKETRSEELMRDGINNAQLAQRRSSDGPAEPARKRAHPPTLREKFKADAAALRPRSQSRAPTSAFERTTLDKPKWQPFVPRSPRNRGHHFPDDVAGGRKVIVPPELPAVPAQSGHGDNHAAVEDGQIDLLSDRFARLGGPGPGPGPGPNDDNILNILNSSMVGNTSKGSLPPDRRAAALARIEKRMAEKKKLRNRGGVSDKENVRP
ncbi:hypothetical protein E4U41_005275 [Claviceps citrina]|nr:hypothetical protein E4U41_005275 [Claviceps citrina]